MMPPVPPVGRTLRLLAYLLCLATALLVAALVALVVLL